MSKKQKSVPAFVSFPSLEEGEFETDLDSVGFRGESLTSSGVTITGTDRSPREVIDVEDIGGGGTNLDKTLAARRRKTNRARPKEDIIEHGSDLVINEDTSEPVMCSEPASDSQINQSGIVAQEPSSPLNSNLHGPSTSGIGRSLRNNFDCWEKLPNSSFACDIISRGVRLPFSNKLKAQRLLKKFDKVRFYSHSKRKTLEEECDRL